MNTPRNAMDRRSAWLPRPVAALLTASMTTLLAAASLTLTACSPDTKPAAGGTLRIVFAADNVNLVSVDPFQVYWIEHRTVLRNVVESLTDQDTKTGEVIPWLAKRWQVSPDALAYTFELRDDVSFSNGTRFDAAAVKTAFDANKAFAASVPTTFGSTYLEGYDHAEVIDAHTVKLVLSKPNAGFLQATSTTNLAILAPESYALKPQERSRGAIIGTGPFVLESYTPTVGIKLAKRKGYAWPSAAAANRGEAYLDRIEISYVPEESVRNGQFLQGKVDVVWPRNPFNDVDLKQFKAKKASVQSRSLPGPAFNLYPNVNGGRVLADPRLRLALQKAIDRRSYATTIYNEDFPLVGSVYDGTTPYLKPQVAKLAHDPNGAVKLLDEAGWTLGDDGYRHKGGDKGEQRLTLVRNLAAETPGDVLLQDQLRKVGIELKLRILVAGELAAANAAGNYDLHSSYMTRGDPIVLQSILDPRFTNRSALSVNAYPKPTLEKAQKLFDAGMRAVDHPERARAYGELQDLLIDDGVVFPVYERIWQAATSDKVRGFAWTSEGFAIFNDIKRTP